MAVAFTVAQHSSLPSGALEEILIHLGGGGGAIASYVSAFVSYHKIWDWEYVMVTFILQEYNPITLSIHFEMLELPLSKSTFD